MRQSSVGAVREPIPVNSFEPLMIELARSLASKSVGLMPLHVKPVLQSSMFWLPITGSFYFKLKGFLSEAQSAGSPLERALYCRTAASAQHESALFTIASYSLIRAFIDDGSR